jgi:hypothetical protein
MSLIKLLCVLTLMVGVASLPGCKSTATPAGVHPSAIPVGGGVDFEFEAPADGVIFVVDSRNNELVSSRSIRSGDVYRLGDDSYEMVRLIGLREHGPSFTLRTDYSDGERKSFPEVQSMKTPVFAVYFASLEQMQFKAGDAGEPRTAQPSATEPSIEELESLLLQQQ